MITSRRIQQYVDLIQDNKKGSILVFLFYLFAYVVVDGHGAGGDKV